MTVNGLNLTSKWRNGSQIENEARSQAIHLLGYLSELYTLAQVGTHFGVSCATVSRAVKQKEHGVD